MDVFCELSALQLPYKAKFRHDARRVSFEEYLPTSIYTMFLRCFAQGNLRCVLDSNFACNLQISVCLQGNLRKCPFSSFLGISSEFYKKKAIETTRIPFERCSLNNFSLPDIMSNFGFLENR